MSTMSSEKIAGRLQFVGLGINMVIFGAFGMWTVVVAVSTNVTVSNPGTSTLDGISITSGDRVLLYGQSTGSQNGPWVFNGSGSAMTRPADWVTGLASGGATFPIEQGTNGDKLAICTTNGAITVDTTSTAFTVMSAGSTYTAGAGLTDTSGTFAVGAGVGITVNADDVALDTSHARNVDHSAVSVIAGAGLTGGGTIAADRTLTVGAGTGITVNADDVAINTSVVPRKFTALVGDGASTTLGVAHSLGNQWVTVQVVEVATGKRVWVDVEYVDANNINLIFAPTAPASNAYRVIIQG
jgi:hypothetical protein